MTDLQIAQFPCLDDNYGVLIHDPRSGETAAIDTPDPDAITDVLEDKGWTLTHILITHHHWDHTQGNEKLKAATGCTIIGPEEERDRIPGLDVGIGDGDTINVCGQTIRILKTGGHTLGHVTYYFPDAGLAFAGDALFPLGCGRMFEGTPDLMWDGLEKLAVLPENTQVYCGHEYTEANARFAVTIEPGNEALLERHKVIQDLRMEGRPTVPTTIGEELATNPFLRPDDPAIRAHLEMVDASDAEVFAEIRQRKDNF